MAEYNINFSTNASQIAKELSKVQTELAKAVQMAKPGGLKIQLSLDASGLEESINTTFRKINKAIESNQRKLSRLQIGGANFRMIAERLGTAEGQRERGRAIAEPIRLRAQAAAFEPGSLTSMQKVLQALRIEASQITPNTVEWVRFQQQIGEVTLELKQADKAAESIQLTQQLGALQPGSLSRLEKQLTILKNRAREIAPNTIEWKKLNKEIQNVETSIAKVNKKPMTMGQRAGAAGGAFLYGGGLGGGAGSALGGIAGGLAGGVPGAFTGAALGQLADNIGQALGATASYTAEIDKQRLALKNVTKDVAEYENALAFIDKTSRDLAIPQDVLNKQFTQLSASVIGAGGDINLAQEAFIGIAAGIRGTGGSLADMEGALRATAQVFSKGKVSAEELRQQIGERLPGAFTLFAKSMGKTPQELDKMLEQGQVTLNDFMGFVRTLSSEYGASASEIAASSQAAGDRLATSMSRMREAVGRELQPLGAQFQEILANAVADNEGNLVALAKAFSQAAQAIGSFIEKYGGLIASLGSTVLLFAGTTMAVKAIAVAFASIGPAIATASLAVAQYGGVMATLKLAIAGLGGPITLVVAGLALLAKGVYDTNEIFRNFVDNVGGILASDFKNAVEGMAEDAGSSANSIQTAYEDLAEKLKPIGSSIEQFFEDVFGSISDDGKSSASNVDNAFTTAFDNILSQGAAAFSGLSALIGNWWNSLPAPIRNILGGNTASILAGAGAYAAALPGRTSAAAQTGGMGNIPPSEGPLNNPDFGKAGGATGAQMRFPSGSGSGSGAGKAKGAGSKPQTYISDLAKDLQRELELRVNAINQDASLSDREREIQEAGMRYNYEILINKAEYYAAVNDENKKDILNRKQYLADLDKALQDQNKLSQQRFEDVVTKPLRSALDEDRQAVIELEGSIASLAKGQSEQTNVEQRQSLIKKVTVGLTEEQSAALKPLFDLLLQTAAARDKLTEAEKRAQAIQEKIQARDSYIVSLQDEIKLLLIIGDEERRLAEIKAQYGDAKAQEIFNLEKIKKNIEETRALIDGFVSSTTSDYKGFLKAVISGEDAADALKQFQEGLKDKVLTIFLDFAMAPVEKFLKESLEGLFLPKAKKEDGKLPEATTKDPVEATNINTTATNANTVALEKVAGALASAGGSYSGLSEATINQGFGSIGGASFGGMQLPGLDKVLENIDFETAFEPLQKDFGATLENLSSTLDTNAYSLSQSAVDYSANFKNVGDSAKKMAEDAGKAAEDAGRNGKDFQESLGKVASGIGIAAGAIMGIAAGISQIKKGGTGNTLMGIGSIMASVGGAIGGFTKLFGANGGVAGGGWKPFPVSAFANGGMVKGPTLGLVGEGKYNEAIVPLPDGRSIPVQMRGAGGSGSRDLLANQAQSRPSPSVLSMSFQSTTINGVEYVDRAQLEAAMEETRRAASREGANKGANLAIDRLANSPSSRRRAGIR
jgi:tape measure domain-containing protein